MKSITHVVSQIESPCGDGYRIAWRINPHMRPGASRRDLARAQHAMFTAALRRAGARVLELPFVPGCYDCVFMKDAAVLARRDGRTRALLARPRHPERGAEVSARRRALERHGFDTAVTRFGLEGGDVVRVGDQLLLGHGFRSEARAADDLARFTGAPVMPVRLLDPHLYHLDTALAWLEGGQLLVAEGALAREDERRLHDLSGVTIVERVPRDEALELGLNVVQIQEQVLLERAAVRSVSRLAGWGYTPVPIPLDQFRLAGGSAACLTAPVLELGRDEHAVVAA